MDFNIDQWVNTYAEAVQKQFGSRVWFIGLQGSYGRGEATSMHTAVASGSWCGAKRQRCGGNGSNLI